VESLAKVLSMMGGPERVENRHTSKVSEGERSDKHCPRCMGTMMTYRYQYFSEVEIAGCTDCGGVHLDDGELRKIADWREAEESVPLYGAEALAQAAWDEGQARQWSDRLRLFARIAMMRFTLGRFGLPIFEMPPFDD
jgi:Zn-finger nucleic acid-binding protein